MKRKNRRNNNNPEMQWTVQDEPMNNHQARRGTKQNAGHRGCKCQHCTATKQPIISKILKSEFLKDIRDME